MLVGGRPETLVAIQAIRDAPILGHGSFPYGPKYIQMKQDIQYQHGYTESDEPEEVEFPVIPTHSHLTMAWVESGNTRRCLLDLFFRVNAAKRPGT